MCVTVQAWQEFMFSDPLCLFCTFILHCVFFLKLQMHTCYTLEYKWEYDVKTQPKLGIRFCRRNSRALCSSVAINNQGFIHDNISYDLFSALPFSLQRLSAVHNNLVPSGRFCERTCTFMSSSLFWGHRSCRQPGFKLRLSISTELGVLVGTFCRGQRSHLGHSFYALTLFPHFPLRSVPRGLFIITRSLCASKGCFGSLESSPWLLTCFPARCCDTRLSVKSFRWQNLWKAL